MMTFYDETHMKSLREAFEKEVLPWENIEQKKMFGCPCVKAAGKLFAFLVNDGIVLTKLTEEQRNKALKTLGGGPFKTPSRTMKKWTLIPFTNIKDLEPILDYIRLSYENVLKIT